MTQDNYNTHNDMKHKGNFPQRSFRSWYSDNADYNTSAPSYYDALANTNEMLDVVQDEVNRDTVEDGLDYEPYLNSIKTTHGRAFNTTYTVIEVENKDSEGNSVILQRGLSSDGVTATNTAEPGYKWNARHYATVLSNASTAQQLEQSGVWRLRGRQVHNGKDIGGLENGVSANRWTLAWGKDGWLQSFPPDVTPAELIEQHGIVEALTSFYPIFMNGHVTSEVWDETGTDQHPRTAIFQRSNGNLLFWGNDGRLGVDNIGMSLQQVYDTISGIYPDIIFGYNLDGGGSSQLYEYGYNHTRPVDNLGNTTRAVGDFIFVGQEPAIERDKNMQHLIDMVALLREKETDNEAYLRNRDPQNNGYITLGGRNNTAARGIYTRTADGELTNALWLNPGGLLEWYDTEQRSDILKLDKEEIIYQGERWGKNMNRYIQPQNDTPIPNESPTGGYLVTRNNPDNPFDVNAIIYLQNANNSTQLEEVTPLATGLKNKKRFKTAGGDWSVWEDI